MAKNNNEADMAAYAAAMESNSGSTIEMPVEQPTLQPQVVNAAKQQEAVKAAEAHEDRMHDMYQDSIAKGLSKAPIPLDNLPSKGLFYPKGTKIWINGATLGDIKRWSSMNEEDIMDVTEKMTSILESCCTITFGPESTIRARWKDLIDVDRLYLLFAIHDYTFKPGQSDVKIKVSEKDDIIMKKENVKYIEYPEKLMNFYNEEKRCFSFPVKNTSAFANTDGKMDIYVTTIGTADWITDYVDTCRQRRDAFDRDFIKYATLLIPNWRYLTVDYYTNLIKSTSEWTAYEWTLISRIFDIINNISATPSIVYHDNGGVERTVPLNFRNGFKSLFQVDLGIDL